MASLHRDNQFKLRALSSALLVCSLSLAASSVFALQEITDEDLGESTGEGIAFLPTNAAFVFRGAGPNESVATLLSDRTNDIGLIRYIPVGPLTTTAASGGAGKGDLYLYGLAVSRGDDNLNSRYSSVNPLIESWGTQLNPWLFKVESEQNVPNFTSGSGNNCSAALCNTVSYLALEAPRYNTTLPTTGATGADAYNLKLAFWADAFVRDPSKVENTTSTGDQFDLNIGSDPSGSRPNRLRLQAVWDGLSLNGSQIQLFQTLAGAATSQTGGNATNTSYNNTLGLTGVLRFNSGDSRASNGFKATVTNGTVARTTSTVNFYSPQTVTGAAAQPNGTNGNCADALQCYQLRAARTTDTYSNAAWTIPAGLPALRFSTRESGTGQGILETPAIGTGIKAPTFDATEGLFAYGANINLVYGTLSQPLIVGKDASSNNLVMEVTRIPNKELIYKRIYTDYRTTGKDASYLGSTCNVYFCGNNGISGYQGTNATHSSISIGSVNYDSVNNLLTAYNGADSIGVSFGALQNKTLGTHAVNYYELQYRYRRQMAIGRWQYLNANGSYDSGTLNCAASGGNCNEFNLADWIGTTSVSGFFNPTISNPAYYVPGRTAGSNFCTGTSATCTGIGNAQVVGPLSGAVYGDSVWISNPPPSAAAPTASGLASNNLGSAVIDGMLIQHMKITTKGL